MCCRQHKLFSTSTLKADLFMQRSTQRNACKRYYCSGVLRIIGSINENLKNTLEVNSLICLIDSFLQPSIVYMTLSLRLKLNLHATNISQSKASNM